MITMNELRQHYFDALTSKNDIQARLRQTAAELVECYRQSLDLTSDEQKTRVLTGYMGAQGYITQPVTLMALDGSKALNFIVSTVLDANPLHKFVVSVSLSLREKDEFVSVFIESHGVPVLLLRDGAEGRYAEAVEAIKQALMEKIHSLV
ncbi:hypothetical protein [Citrobacter braakii]|uniref:hypothetical protein n=1 Tax=Citrobacter braakii TaxID=57706 RepID=UPI00351CE23C